MFRTKSTSDSIQPQFESSNAIALQRDCLQIGVAYRQNRFDGLQED
jgi:hypothetical protein